MLWAYENLCRWRKPRRQKCAYSIVAKRLTKANERVCTKKKENGNLTFSFVSHLPATNITFSVSHQEGEWILSESVLPKSIRSAAPFGTNTQLP